MESQERIRPTLSIEVAVGRLSGGAVVMAGERGDPFATTAQRMESRRRVCCDGARGGVERWMRAIFGFSDRLDVAICDFWLAGGNWAVMADCLSE